MTWLKYSSGRDMHHATPNIAVTFTICLINNAWLLLQLSRRLLQSYEILFLFLHHNTWHAHICTEWFYRQDFAPSPQRNSSHWCRNWDWQQTWKTETNRNKSFLCKQDDSHGLTHSYCTLPMCSFIVYCWFL